MGQYSVPIEYSLDTIGDFAGRMGYPVTRIGSPTVRIGHSGVPPRILMMIIIIIIRFLEECLGIPSGISRGLPKDQPMASQGSDDDGDDDDDDDIHGGMPRDSLRTSDRFLQSSQGFPNGG